MAVAAGRDGIVLIDGSTDLCIVDMTFNGNLAELDTTCHGQDNRSYIPGRTDATLDMTVRWDIADTALVALETAFFGNAEVAVDYRPINTSGLRRYTGQAIVTSFSPTSPNDDVADLDVSLRFTGAITVTTIP